MDGMRIWDRVPGIWIRCEPGVGDLELAAGDWGLAMEIWK